MAVTVRPLRDDEIRLYLQIHERAIRGLAAGHYSEDAIEGWVVPATAENVRRLTLNADREIRLLAELDGKPVGIGALVLEASELRAVYVSPEGARQGCGSALVHETRADRQGRRRYPPHAPRLPERGAVLLGPRLQRARKNGSRPPQRPSHGGRGDGKRSLALESRFYRAMLVQARAIVGVLVGIAGIVVGALRPLG